MKQPNPIFKKYNKVKPRTLLMLALFLGAAGASQAGPQPAPPVAGRQAPSPVAGRQAPSPVPARQPLPTTVAANPANPANQAATEPAPTKLIRVYRGEGYFDNALAEKLRPVLTGKPEPAPSQGSPAPKFTLRQ
jgi:hypothetical protein